MSHFPFLKHPVRVKDTESGSGDFFDYAVTSCQGWRNTQEDVHLILPTFEPGGSSLFAVFDGHNGIEVAAYSARHLPKHILASEKYRSGQIVDGLKEAFLALDAAIKNAGKELSDIRAMLQPQVSRQGVDPGVTSGCTAVVCLLHKDIFYCANVGDSRCVLSRDGRSLALSHDHTPELPRERSRIEAAGGNVLYGRINSIINVSRALGDHCFKDNVDLPATDQMISPMPDVAVEPFQPGRDQFLALVCDGVWNSLDNQALVDFVRDRLEKKEEVVLSAITEAVVDAILPPVLTDETGVKGKDNMTILLVKFNRK